MSPLQVVGTELKPQAPLQLRVKQVSLGKEIAFISVQERRLEKRRAKARAWKPDDNENGNHRRRDAQVRLELHRKELRIEARATNLARGFLKGFPYERIENACYVDNEPPFERAGEIALKFAVGDERVLKQTFEAWVQEGTLYFGAHAIKLEPEKRYPQRLEARGRQLCLTPEQRTKHYEDWRFFQKSLEVVEAERIELDLGLDGTGEGRGPLAKVPLLKPTQADRL